MFCDVGSKFFGGMVCLLAAPAGFHLPVVAVFCRFRCWLVLFDSRFFPYGITVRFSTLVYAGRSGYSSLDTCYLRPFCG